MRRSWGALGLIAVLSLLVLSACASASRVTYIPDGDAFTADDLASRLEDSDPGAAARVTAEDALEVRQSALADLRTNGEDAAGLADLLTLEFPTDVLAVPYTVELGTYEGESAWIVFEAWTDAGPRLSGRRVWVFAHDDLAMLAAHSTD